MRAAAAGGTVLILLLGAIYFWPMPASLNGTVQGTTTLVDIRGREIAALPSVDARAQFPRELPDLGPWLPKVTVALEDHRFYDHGAVDWRGIGAALFRNVKAGCIISGGSTITQQLAKLARGRRHRGVLHKIDEAVVAWKLEHRWGKERILTEYLNRSSFGNRRLGPEAAARAYFGKSARELTLAESIFLGGLPQAPSRFNPWRHAVDANRRYTRSVRRLAQLKIITGDEANLLGAAMPNVQRFDPPRLAPHYVDALLGRKTPVPNGIVRTTLDLNLQQRAESLLRQHLAGLNRYDISQAAVVIVDNETGAVRAMVGSEDYRANQVNGAMRPRSSGSTLKPFVYLRAIDQRVLTAATLLPDTADAVRDQYADYDPQNYNRRFLGPVRMREALGCSLNVPAVVTVSRLGARQTFFELQKWGFKFPRQFGDYGAGFVLGNAEIRLVDLAGAYAGLARRGVGIPAKLLPAEHYPINRIASTEAADIITDILCDNRARERTFGAHSPLAFEQRIAVKTGTSSGFRDAWTVGFNKQHTVAVWAGNLDGRPMRDTFAVRSATPLWAGIMHDLLAGGDQPLDPPKDNEQIVRRTVCAQTGMLPSRFSKDTVSEMFIRGTEPTQDSTGWFSSDGKMLLPPEYAAWCRSGSNTDSAQTRSASDIINPAANAHYTVDSSLPAHQQMIELTANLPGDTRWFVNDAPIQAQPGGRVFWQLAPGDWTVRAVAGNSTFERQVHVD